MQIGLSAFVLQGGKTGVAKYILGLMSGLKNVDQKNAYEIYVNKSDSVLISSKDHFHLNIYPDIIKQPIVNILWHHFALPFKKVDLVHIPTIRRVPLIKGTKMIATVHDLAPLLIRNKYGRLRDLYHTTFLKTAIHRLDHIIAVSKTTKKDIIELTGYPEQKISVIYLGIDSEDFYPIEKQKAKAELFERYKFNFPFLVYVSRIEYPGKNHIRLIQAFESLKQKEGYPHHLILIGADWNGAKQVRDYANRSLWKECIHFLGFVPQKDLVFFYSGSDLVVFPSIYEGFGLPLIEAMASGASVACSSTSSLLEISSGYARVFSPYDIEEMETVLIKALKEPDSSEKRKRVIDYAATFNWEDVAKKTINVYENIV